MHIEGQCLGPRVDRVLDSTINLDQSLKDVGHEEEHMW